MRNRLKIIIVFSLVFSFFLTSKSLEAIEVNDITPNATASILIEANSKEVIIAKNEHEKLYPASTTKIMTMILLFEAVEQGKLNWEEILTTSAYASSMGGSQIYLETNEQMSIEDLFKAIAIASANDACVVIAERIGGTNENFIMMMNQKAKELGLNNTNFVNATGLHDDNHYSSAYDLSIMAAYLIEIGADKLLETTKTFDTYIRENTEESFWLVNTNKLLNSYQGIDGLKTGFTKESGYCIVATATRDNLRFISVVLNEPEPATRNQEASALLDFGFNQYEANIIFNKGTEITKIQIPNSKVKEVIVITSQDIIVPLKKGEEYNNNYEIEIIKQQAPLYKGEVIGYLHLFSQDNQNSIAYDLIIDDDVLPYTFYQFFEQIFKKLLN